MAAQREPSVALLCRSFASRSLMAWFNASRFVWLAALQQQQQQACACAPSTLLARRARKHARARSSFASKRNKPAGGACAPARRLCILRARKRALPLPLLLPPLLQQPDRK